MTPHTGTAAVATQEFERTGDDEGSPQPAGLGRLAALRQLSRDLREDARVLRDYDAGAMAAVLERVAEKIDAAILDDEEELLTLQKAAIESGYSAYHLARLIRAGKIPNAGRKNAPRIQRGALPRKAGYLPNAEPKPTFTDARRRIALSVVNSNTGENDG